MTFLDSAAPSPDSGAQTRRNRRPMLAFLLVTLAVGALGNLFVEPSLPSWYAGLNHPAIAPPNWVFAPVWTTLYILMAVAAWRVWRVTGLRSLEMGLYGGQLALNLGWSVLFFGLHRMGAAFGDTLLLIALILATAIVFWRRDRIAGALLLPYLAWSCFAAALNYAFWAVNA